jgi:hypothetical protein
MPSDFTVVFRVRQWFGDREEDITSGGTPLELSSRSDAPFVGISKTYAFKCPEVDTSAEAILQFESLGATNDTWHRNTISINGTEIPGGITPGPATRWKTHSLIVPSGVVKEQNSLTIEAQPLSVTGIDSFVIDNVVLHYKTRTRPPVARTP